MADVTIVIWRSSHLEYLKRLVLKSVDFNEITSGNVRVKTAASKHFEKKNKSSKSFMSSTTVVHFYIVAYLQNIHDSADNEIRNRNRLSYYEIVKYPF